jgi:hypothetical protein
MVSACHAGGSTQAAHGVYMLFHVAVLLSMQPLVASSHHAAYLSVFAMFLAPRPEFLAGSSYSSAHVLL